MIRVLVVQGEKLAREGLRLLIEREADMTVAGEAEDMKRAARLAARLRPDVLLVDLEGPDGEELDAVSAFMQDHPAAFVAVMTAFRIDRTIARALELDIPGFILKRNGFGDVCRAIRAACRGESFYSGQIMDRLLAGDGNPAPSARRKTRLQSLTRRERELLKLLAVGLSLKDACGELKVSYKTGDKHKVSLMKKLDIHDRVKLARFAIREKLVEAWEERDEDGEER